jgi:hypothetical protein
MKIIIEGNLVETKDIWDIELIDRSREIWLNVKIIDKPDIKIGRQLPYDASSSTIQGYSEPYKRLYNSIKNKLEQDKTDLEIFKL